MEEYTSVVPGRHVNGASKPECLLSSQLWFMAALAPAHWFCIRAVRFRENGAMAIKNLSFCIQGPGPRKVQNPEMARWLSSVGTCCQNLTSISVAHIVES